MTGTRHPGDYVKDVRIRTFGEHSQERAALAAGISQPYLSQIERGTRALTGNMAIKMERGWGLEPSELIRWSNVVLDTLSADSGNGANPGLFHDLKSLLFPFPAVAEAPA